MVDSSLVLWLKFKGGWLVIGMSSQGSLGPLWPAVKLLGLWALLWGPGKKCSLGSVNLLMMMLAFRNRTQGKRIKFHH